MKTTELIGKKENRSVKKISIIAMLSAMAYVSTMLLRFPVISFLKFDPKDVIIVLGGMIYGPAAAILISTVSSLVEMLTISDTGIIGFAMNIFSSMMYALVASLIYKKDHTLRGAVGGLLAGSIAMTAGMLLFNYIVTPLYMNVDRAVVAGMLLPVFLPFNLFKASLNTAVMLLVYKPLITALRKAHLVPPDSISSDPAGNDKKYKLIALISLLVIVAGTVTYFVISAVVSAKN